MVSVSRIRFIIAFLAFSAFACQSSRREANFADYQRILERLAQERVIRTLNATETNHSPSDFQIIKEVCEQSRIEPLSFWKMLKSQNSELYTYLSSDQNED
jgi:hypothetical protein